MVGGWFGGERGVWGWIDLGQVGLGWAVDKSGGALVLMGVFGGVGVGGRGGPLRVP